MKHAKKFAGVLLALVMVLGLHVTAFAQEVDTGKGGQASITISNAAKGETYAVYKLFDAAVTGVENGSIAYTGTIPESLKNFFEQDTAGNILAKDAAFKEGNKTELSEAAVAALKAWTAESGVTAEKSEVSDGSDMIFNNLQYGYYVVTTTQGSTAITVDSTNPNATIHDKNATVPTLVSKTVDDENVYIGQTVEYQVVFNTSNYHGEGQDAKQIVSYTIQDTLPSFLSNVNVTSIKVDEDANPATPNDQTDLVVSQFDVDKKITIPWVDGTNNSLYKNGAAIIITYTATVTDDAAIAGSGNTNTVTLTWKTTDTEEHGDTETKSATIKTYAIALKKVNVEGEPLAGATFEFPFYVKKTPDVNGAYIYAFASLPTEFPEGDSADNYTKSLTTPGDGVIVVKGLESGTEVAITETAAPAGYNRLTAQVKATPVVTTETTTNTTIKLDAEGNAVEQNETTTVTYTNDKIAATVVAVLNKTGVELPSTGGMGTTIFYVVGTILVFGAAVLLITRKRMNAEK